MRVGGGEATGPTGSASFLPRLSLPGCLPRAGGGRDEPYGLRAPGWGMDCPTRTHFCWAPGTQAWETGGAWVLLPTKPPLCSCAQLWKQSVPSIIHLISQCHNKLLEMIPHFQMGKLRPREQRGERQDLNPTLYMPPKTPSQLTNSLPSPL